MKAEALLDCIGSIDDDIVEETHDFSAKARPIKRSRRTQTYAAALAAACLLVVAVLATNLYQPYGFIVNPHSPSPVLELPVVPTTPLEPIDNPRKPVTAEPSGQSDFSGLPKLTVVFESDGVGLGGVMAFDVSELYSNNPWTIDSDLEVLPVFANPDPSYRGKTTYRGLSADEMTVRVQYIANALGVTIEELVIKYPTEYQLQHEEEITGKRPENAPWGATATCKDITILIYANGQTAIIFEKGKPLPHGYSFVRYNTGEQQAMASMRYLLAVYSVITDFKASALSLFGHYTYDAVWTFDYGAYENSGNLTEQILNYNFGRITFTPDDNGNLFYILLPPDTYWSQKLGDYPIITADEARSLLLAGHSIKALGVEEFPGEAYIARVELVYRVSVYDEVFMPYYEFLVEIPTRQLDNGLKTFCAYYVPAVRGEFLEDMPLWDGGWN